jgi:hypothetical protein
MFQDEIWPDTIAVADAQKSCVTISGCHARQNGRSALRLIPMPQSPGDWQMNYDVVVRFLNCNTAEASSFVTKPASGGDPHAGGDLWPEAGDPTDKVITWIRTGQ